MTASRKLRGFLFQEYNYTNFKPEDYYEGIIYFGAGASHASCGSFRQKLVWNYFEDTFDPYE